ncbi:MAG: hypothetical protein IKO47_05590 [Ruminococcus sp.]|nr:hypothetical protein [Ruminococcus sp.]
MSFWELAMRTHHHRHHYRNGGLSTAGLVTLLIFLAVCGFIVYFYIRVKKNGMMQTLGFDNEADYKDYKKNCPVNYRNIFCMSDEWVINERTYKIYSPDDILDVSPLSSGSSGSLARCGILIRYKGGSDKVFVSKSWERDKLIKEIKQFLSGKKNGALFI